MELTFDDQKMQFYPTYNAIYELLCVIVNKIATSLPDVKQKKNLFLLFFSFYYRLEEKTKLIPKYLFT